MFTNADNGAWSTHLATTVEQNASASRDLCTSLAHPLKRQQDLLHVAAQRATRKDVYVMAVIEKVQGGLQHADM